MNETTCILYDVAESRGWGAGTQFDLLLEYIENQKSPEAFRDFLLDKVSTEKEQSEE